jgi:hypothetical protein
LPPATDARIEVRCCTIDARLTAMERRVAPGGGAMPGGSEASAESGNIEPGQVQHGMYLGENTVFFTALGAHSPMLLATLGAVNSPVPSIDTLLFLRPSGAGLMDCLLAIGSPTALIPRALATGTAVAVAMAIPPPTPITPAAGDRHRSCRGQGHPAAHSNHPSSSSSSGGSGGSGGSTVASHHCYFFSLLFIRALSPLSAERRRCVYVLRGWEE